jgi:hypothetical protein
MKESLGFLLFIGLIFGLAIGWVTFQTHISRKSTEDMNCPCVITRVAERHIDGSSSYIIFIEDREGKEGTIIGWDALDIGQTHNVKDTITLDYINKD